MISTENELTKLINKKKYGRLKLYVNLGFDLTLTDINGDYVSKYGDITNLAFKAVIDNNLEKLKLLPLNMVNSVNNNNYTPLHWAIITHRNNIAKYIIENGNILSFDQVTFTGDNCFSLAARYNNAEILLFLLEKNPLNEIKIFKKNNKGFNALHFSCALKNIEIIVPLLSVASISNFMEKNIYGANILHWLVHGAKRTDAEKLDLIKITIDSLHKHKNHKGLVKSLILDKNALGFTPLNWLELYDQEQSYNYLKNI